MTDLINYNVEFYERVRKLLENEIAGKSDSLSRGTCDTLGEYKARSGEVEGLRQAIYLMTKVADELKKEDE